MTVAVNLTLLGRKYDRLLLIDLRGDDLTAPDQFALFRGIRRTASNPNIPAVNASSESSGTALGTYP